VDKHKLVHICVYLRPTNLGFFYLICFIWCRNRKGHTFTNLPHTTMVIL